MKRNFLRLIPLVILLGGCIDFVDPVGLQLAKEHRLDLSLRLVDDPGRASCAGASAPAQPGDATAYAALCLEAKLVPGKNKYGERLAVLDDTLRFMGTPVLPTVDEDSTYRYEHGVLIPLRRVAETPITITYPTVEGGAVAPNGIRWYAAGRTGPDEIVRAPGEDLRFDLDLPAFPSNPAPRSQFSLLQVTGNVAAVTVQSGGAPLPAYHLPAEVLADLGGERYRAVFTWRRQYAARGENYRVNLQFLQDYRWIVVPPEPPEE